jgi:uncharacterized protein
MPARGPFAAFLRFAAIAACCMLLTVPDSLAQNTGGLPGFLQHLFGGFNRPQAPQTLSPAPAPRAPPRKAPRKRSEDFVPASTTRPFVEPKAFLSVLGDSLGLLTGQGLSAAFADRPEISISSRGSDNSGLTRDDYFDWPKEARGIAAQTPKPNVVVIQLGINDPQPMRVGGETLDTLSDKWKAAYGARVESMVAPFREAQIPGLWVGLPPMRDEKFNAQALALNEIFRSHAGASGAKYIDIWDAFADSDGRYAAFGPDVDGQNAKLRAGANGVNFTKAGARKVAQFLEADIRRIVDKAAPPGEIAALPPDIEQEADSINQQIRREMGVEGAAPGIAAPPPLAGPILSLSARPVSAHGALIEPASAPRIFAAGEPSAPRPGRADDFPWPRPN